MTAVQRSPASADDPPAPTQRTWCVALWTSFSALALALGLVACGDADGSRFGGEAVGSLGERASGADDNAGTVTTSPSDTEGESPSPPPEEPSTGDTSAPDGGAADGDFPWLWVIGVGVTVIAVVAVVAAYRSARGRAARRWRARASRLAHEGRIVVDMATIEPLRAQPSPFTLEMLLSLEGRLDNVVHLADEVGRVAPDVRSTEVVAGVADSGRSFAAAVAAERASRQASLAATPDHTTFSTERLIERRQEFDLNLRELTWRLQDHS